jgi:cell division protein FtsZ
MNMPLPPIKRTPIECRKPVLKVIGLGGGGQNAVNRMIDLGMKGVDFIAANTDGQVLASSSAPTKIQLGPKLTRGLGAGGDPTVGEAAAEESVREITSALVGADMVFLTAGMGGGTGTGAISVAARVARSLGAVVVAVVSTPFAFEMGKRQKNAQVGLEKLRQYTDTLIVVPNERLVQIAGQTLTFEMAFRLADDVLRQGIQAISELITQPGMINVDFSHIRQAMYNGGGSLMAIGQGQGERKASIAIENALHHPMLDEIRLDNATHIIANFTGGADLTFAEVIAALESIQQLAGENAEVIPGVICDERMEGRAEVILIVTGVGGTPVDAQRTAPVAAEQPGGKSEPMPLITLQRDLPDLVETDGELVSMEAGLGIATVDLEMPAFLRKRMRN